VWGGKVVFGDEMVRREGELCNGLEDALFQGNRKGHSWYQVDHREVNSKVRGSPIQLERGAAYGRGKKRR